MTLPFALDHINLWLLRDTLEGVEGWTVVDCCISRDEAKAQWEADVRPRARRPAHPARDRHPHAPGPHRPGRTGCASGGACSLWISATDYHTARIGSQSTTGFGGDGAAAFFASHGMIDPGRVWTRSAGRAGYYPDLVPSVPLRLPPIDGRADGAPSAGATGAASAAFGHAPEHIALYCDELQTLISGDMVLPRISTNVSVYDTEPEADSLTLFLDSLDKFLPLPEDTLVLPSHGKPFTGLHERVQQLQRPPPRPSGRGDARPVALNPAARWTSFRCCSPARWTCTR